MKVITSLAIVLTVVGAVNWGLVGLGDFIGMNLNLVNLFVGSWPVVENIVYLLVGISGLMVAATHATKQCHM